MSLIYIDRVYVNRSEFETKVVSICKKLDIDPNWLMATMWIESDIDPTAVNSITGAVGLIQFLPSTAVELGTTTSALKIMSNVAQLDYVYKYLKEYKSQIKSFVDCYLAVFWPAAIGKYSDYVLQTMGLSASYVAGQNSGYDENKDNELTYREIESHILAAVDPEYRSLLKSESVPSHVSWDAARIIKTVLAVLLIGFGGFLLYKTLRK